MSILISRRVLAAAVVGLAVLLCASNGLRADADKDPALTFIQGLGDQAVTSLRDNLDMPFEVREAAFREVMVRGFDIPIVGRFVLGRHWRTATKEQRREYMAGLRRLHRPRVREPLRIHTAASCSRRAR